MQLQDDFVPNPDQNAAAALPVHAAQDTSCRMPQQRMQLPDDFVPSNMDIICGRGKQTHVHFGNKRFRATIAMNVERYVQAETKVAKSVVVLCIVNEIRKTSAFVKKDEKTGKWFDIGDQSAKEKVGHALRDLITAHSKKRSATRSTESKKSPAEKKRSRRKVARTVSVSEDSDELCDDFFRNFVVDTFLGKTSNEEN